MTSPTQSRTTLSSVISSARDAKAHPRTSPASARESVHVSHKEWAAQGKAARRDAPRSSHAKWEPAANRPDPVALLEEQAESRVPELVPIRHGRMLVSPSTFYRGAAFIMAADLAPTPVSGFEVQLCGDAHLLNFGLFASPERQMLFDINDFDETLPGPWEWDVKRLAASFEVAGRDLGFSPSDRRDIVTAGAHEYRDAMRRAAQMGALEAWYAHLSVDDMMSLIKAEVRDKRLSKKEAKEAAGVVAKARSRVHSRALTRLAGEVDGRLRIVAVPPLIVPIDDVLPPGTARMEKEAWLRELFQSYRHSLAQRHHPIEEFRYVDGARKVVGVGSVGTRAWIFLLLGRQRQAPLFLQAKEAQASVLERFVGMSEYANHGQRVVEGQRLMQAASDIFLGWLRLKSLDGKTRDFYVRQLHDWKGSVNVDAFRAPGATLYARLCGATLARAHARLGDRVAIASYLGRGDAFDKAIAAFSVSYADQNERDYKAFAKAVKSGRLNAETGL
ncbi:MAG: DUF2252 domain-containing protein [Actinobacteria bacterium]|nr:DUF2252 domain-containing protein [Actinomycetota bacterium]